MIKIAHRGNINGPDQIFENSPTYVEQAILSGYDAEVDFWAIDGQLYFGHDNPQYEVDPYFIHMHIKKLWLHCKNIEALRLVMSMPKYYRGFWHQNDDFTITTNHFIWTYPDKPITDKSILVCKDLPDYDIMSIGAAGICSPYIGRL